MLTRRDFLQRLLGGAALLALPYEPKRIYSFPSVVEPVFLVHERHVVSYETWKFAELLAPDLKKIYVETAKERPLQFPGLWLGSDGYPERD